MVTGNAPRRVFACAKKDGPGRNALSLIAPTIALAMESALRAPACAMRASMGQTAAAQFLANRTKPRSVRTTAMVTDSVRVALVAATKASVATTAARVVLPLLYHENPNPNARPR